MAMQRFHCTARLPTRVAPWSEFRVEEERVSADSCLDVDSGTSCDAVKRKR